MLCMSVLYGGLLLIFYIFMAKIPEGVNRIPLNQCFKVRTESRGVDDEVHVHCVCESEEKIERKWHQKQVKFNESNRTS